MEVVAQIYRDTHQGMKEYLEFNQIKCPETERELEQIKQIGRSNDGRIFKGETDKEARKETPMLAL